MENRDVVSDFRRRYENTYVWLSMPEQQAETLVHIDQVQDSDTKMAVLTLTSEEYGQLQVNYGSSEHVLRFRYPPVGVFQHGDQPYLFMRRPARQYRRGLCSDNSQMTNVTRWLVGNMGRWSHAEVASAFRHTIFSFYDAMGRLKSERKLKGVALADEYSLVRSMFSDSKDHVLFHWQNPVARINPADGTMTKLLEPSYESEILRVVGGI